ncbi:hypothetical protein P175DRAFT_0500915 [Aspergillus ochraceoroseus IBT 24754]|uniref:GST C-terminal domain-containing protein n=1 Tax=Aspergillus ochraceoroseus IBT 24754 TaxID=1392256 RepID=A0A2T5M0L1_9EURO|nr:uncharacterized protein P175DRAFT_0500915 [Aspergillus ochraceoroseus IBT 24754]PTU22066.1 hypothetical protein P175DRAFT_0500915 [Aspergillus ochraceoroseus IBT 24754]
MNVFDERSGQIALYSSPASNDGASIAMLLEFLWYARETSPSRILSLFYYYIISLPHCVHLVNHPGEIHDMDARKATSLPLITDVTGMGTKHIIQHEAITRYLLSTYDTSHKFSYPQDAKECDEINTWLSFLSQTIHPPEMPEDTPFARRALTLYLHLEQHLQQQPSPYLVGKKYTLADFAIFPYAAAASSVGLDLERFPEVTTWYNRLVEQNEVQKGMKAVHLKI